LPCYYYNNSCYNANPNQVPVKKTLLLLTILPLFLMQFSNTAYRHSHVLPDGQVVEHSHPFRSSSDKPGPGHQHCNRELLLFTIISDSNPIPVFLALAIVVYRTREIDLEPLRVTGHLPSRAVSHQFMRAPPALY
jgi:hypothetical protein